MAERMREGEFVEGVTTDVQHNGNRCVVYAAMHPAWLEWGPVDIVRERAVLGIPSLADLPKNNSVLARVLVRFSKNMHVPQSRQGSLMQQPPKFQRILGGYYYLAMIRDEQGELQDEPVAFVWRLAVSQSSR